MKKHEDHRFIEALISHNEKVIEEIYSKFSGLIISQITSNSGTVDDAKDIFQEALMALLRMAENGFVLKHSFKNYFSGICRYMWIDKIKEKQRRQRQELDYSKVTNIHKSGQLDEEDIKSTLLKEAGYQLFTEKFLALSPHCQEIIGLSWTKNASSGKRNSMKEVAEILDITYGYVRKEKSNCVNKLIRSIKSDPRYKLLKNLDLWTIDLN